MRVISSFSNRKDVIPMHDEAKGAHVSYIMYHVFVSEKGVSGNADGRVWV